MAKPVLVVQYANSVEYTQIYLKSSCSFARNDCGIRCSDDAVSFLSYTIMRFFRGITGPQCPLITEVFVLFEFLPISWYIPR